MVDVAPDVVTFSTAISACADGREWKQALLLLREIPATGALPNKISYNAVIAACGKGHQWKAALGLL